MIKIIAWISLILSVLGIFTEPFLYGKEREPHGNATWIAALITAFLTIPLCLKVLGVF